MKKFNNIGKNVVFVVLVIAVFTGLLCGCKPQESDYQEQGITGLNQNYNNKPLTIEEITQKTWEKYFNEDGTAKRSAWSYGGGELRVNSLDDITGFEVSFIKDVRSQKPIWYLIEFESIGFIHGQIYLDYGATFGTGLRVTPSPFKILGIDPDNRYCDLWEFATIRDGVMTAISDEAYVQYQNAEMPENWHPGMKTYDYEKNTWIDEYHKN